MLTQPEALAIAAQAADRHIQRLRNAGSIVAATAEFFNVCASMGMQALDELEPGRWKVGADMDDWRSPRMVVELVSPPLLTITVTMSGENPPPLVKRATMNWHTNPPEWAAYVNQVLIVARPSELHLSADMSCKRVDCDVMACEAGRLVLVFHPDQSAGVKWPDDPGPWTHEERSPTLTIEVGEALTDDMECVSCGTGRYTVRASCVRRVDWQDEAAVQEVAGP